MSAVDHLTAWLTWSGIIFTGLFAWLGNRKSGQVKAQTQDIHESLGMRNGHTLMQLVEENRRLVESIAAQNEYMHTRNHDIINVLSRIELLLTNQAKRQGP